MSERFRGCYVAGQTPCLAFRAFFQVGRLLLIGNVEPHPSIGLLPWKGRRLSRGLGPLRTIPNVQRCIYSWGCCHNLPLVSPASVN